MTASPPPPPGEAGRCGPGRARLILRSLAFNVALTVLTGAGLLAMCLLAPFRRRAMQRVVVFWARANRFLLKRVVGLDVEVRGLERVPRGPVIIASKHQSAWDTAVFFLLFDDPRYILKKELLSIPIWGWCAIRSGAIAVDRAGGGRALKGMVKASTVALAEGSQVVIFPEGTRVRPGERRDYQPGVAALYAAAAAPVVPVAVNSGLFWERRSFVKRPGAVTIEFLPEMPTGLPRKDFMAELERRIEDASARLRKEALARFAWLPPAAPPAGSGA